MDVTLFFTGLKQKYTQSAGRRPFGISCLVTGFDDDGTPHLYQTDPAGIYSEWKANAIGRSAKTVREFLEKNYSADVASTEETTIKLAVKALLEVRFTPAEVNVHRDYLFFNCRWCSRAARTLRWPCSAPARRWRCCPWRISRRWWPSSRRRRRRRRPSRRRSAEASSEVNTAPILYLSGSY